MLILGILLVAYALRSYLFSGSGKMRRLGRNKKRSIGIGILCVLILVALAGCIVFTVMQNYGIDKDINGWLDRAQVSSNPTDMKNYLIECKEGMIKWELTDEHDAIIFETPENDMELIMKALERSIDRCHEIEKMDTGSPEYQTALDDVRGQIRELDLHSNGRYWVKHWYVFPIILLLITLFIICFLLALAQELQYRTFF